MEGENTRGENNEKGFVSVQGMIIQKKGGTYDQREITKI
jgi:hypothetical protein